MTATPKARIIDLASQLAARSMDLARMEGASGQDIARLSAHVYASPAGNPAQECGGVAISLLAYHHAAGTLRAYGDRPTSPESVGQRQGRMADWVATRISPQSLGSLRERAMRIAEEAIELAQACGASRGDLEALDKPPHTVASGATVRLIEEDLEQIATALGLDAISQEERELRRIESKPASHFAQRQAAKVAAGIITTGRKKP